MSEYEPELLEFRLSVPPRIADAAIPRLASTTNGALAAADQAIAELVGAVSDAGLDISSLLAGVLIRLEAISSSQIEDLDADLETELVRDHTELNTINAETALVRHNIGIVASAITDTTGISAEWLCTLHRRLMEGSDLLSHHIGSFRDCPVWIGRSRATAEFEGPPHLDVSDLIDDLVVFAQRADVHPVVQASIAHAQFETIHPFVDGNGRIGRALVHPILRRVAHGVIVPASHALLARREEYFAGLGSYRAGDLNEWIATFADAVVVAARAATGVTIGLSRLSRSWQDQIKTHRDGTARAILESLPTNPIVTISSARALRNVSQPAALAAVTRLADTGVLRPTTVETPGKAHVWVAGGVMDVLASVEHSMGRRTE